MNEQDKVAEFIEEHEMDGTLEFRILDLVSEVGEIAKDATKSADYGKEPEKLSVKKDEIGDVLFSLLAVAESLDIDAGEALDTALEKYEKRIKEKGDPSSK
jgi:NTP pyrophosphatase (non-canonical NTP hydrolase)